MKTMTMCDCSHWQNEKLDEYISDYDILAHKASEGVSLVDKECERRCQLFGASKAMILYHVVKRDNYNAQVQFFSKIIESMPNYKWMGVALDFENSENYFPYNTGDLVIEAIEEFNDFLTEKYNKRIIVYLGDLYQEGVYNCIRSLDLGLWIPRYGKFPQHAPDIWQFQPGKVGTNEPLDKNTFYGDKIKLNTFLVSKN